MHGTAQHGRIGLWLVGARGSVASTAVTGAAAVAAGIVEPTGLVTAREPFDGLGLPELGELAFGGHDVTDTPLTLRAASLAGDGVLPAGLPAALAGPLAAAEAELRPGIGQPEARADPRGAVDRVARDLRDFRDRLGLEQVVM